MNIQRWKGIVWLGSLAVGGYLVFYVSDFLRQRDALAQEIGDADLVAVLDSVKKPAEQKTDVVDYAAINQVFLKFDWTGKPPEKVVAPDKTGPTVVPKVAVSNLLKVLAIKVDTSKPEKSVAYVKFVNDKLATHIEKEDTLLRPGERLFSPFQDVLVESVGREGVVFAFDDAARPKETVSTAVFTSSQRGELGIVMVGPEGAIMPSQQKRIDQATDFTPFRPETLMQVRKNEFQVGTETLKELDADYSRILSRDLSYGPYKNPRTGATEGLKINRVAPNSIPAQAGLTEGEVLKSINGHKVTSVNDAIAFVKANANSTDTWIGVFEKQGREFTRTYYSPDK